MNNRVLRRAKQGLGVILLMVGVSASLTAQAYYSLVAVANPGNANDVTGFGAVSYPYYIGEKEVSISQYTEFLTAVAANDTHGLYNPAMGSIANVAGIQRSGTAGNYSYSVIGDSGDRPVTSVSWFNAARFANWMSNGQPSGAQGPTTTEDGAYLLPDPTGVEAVVKNDDNPNTGSPPLYYIPTENEWYKAAYYNPTLNNGAGGYYLYATQSNTLPGNAIGNSANQANYISETTGYCVTQTFEYSSSQNYLTDGGAFTGSSSFYGTYDQTGNVWEWNDMDGTASTVRGFRGGAYTSTPPYLQSTYRMGYTPDRYNANGGFRLASPW